MKPTKQLIRGLRETAQQIRERPNDYCWASPTSCNCGLLARNLLGLSLGELQDLVWYKIGLWSKDAPLYLYCQKTGLPLKEIGRLLSAAGLEKNDFNRIENLDEKMFDRSTPSKVAAWMDAEADKLEARRAAGERPEKQ